MPQFAYKAKQGPQNVVSGVIEADSMEEAVGKLTKAGQIPVEVKPSQAPSSGGQKTPQQPETKVSTAALQQFTRQLADLLEAGIPIARCMELLSRQRRFPSMAPMVAAMATTLQQGASFSQALAQYPQVFPGMYIHTVKAAEKSGQLPLVTNRLAEFLESDLQMRSKARASLIYPAVILGVGILTLFVLLSFVLPRLTMMFEDFDTELPLVTRIVVAISGVFGHFWWLMAGLAVALIVGGRRYIQSPQGRAALDAFLLNIPVLKSFIEEVQMGRFARTLGMLLESGVPIVAALESVVSVVDNMALQEEIRAMTAKVKAGLGLAQAMKTSRFFPEVAFDLIAVGQESGKLEKGLYKLADQCERSAQESSQTFMTILGPAVLVVVVGVVGFMIVAMLLPMFQMNMIIH